MRIAETDEPDTSRDVPVKKQIYNAAVYHSNEVTVDGLKPSTSYTYQAGSDAMGWITPVTFTTDDGDVSWNFITMSDAQIGVGGKVTEQSANWDKATTTAFERFPESTMLLHLGDQVEGWGAPKWQYEEFAKPEALKRYPTAVLEGNHETYAPLNHFRQRFHLPNEVGEISNYFFERNNMLFIGLNSNENDADSIEKHARFIRETIAEHGADKDWVVVGMHHAIYSQGSHNSDSEVQRLRAGLAPVFTEEDVNLVLTGHDHIYTRSHLMEGTTPVEPAEPPQRGRRADTD
ncbi:purple acid phosphatase family protein [Corynebacterium cystitidis]|uniref:purple acid phosphatase family protein n=1 Tax=Corynebacterium cystitidis TaxID=35757 RepID=UPI00211DE7C7|nr:metallophosphoesterase family protein [Corynebacterium cystitidis]